MLNADAYQEIAAQAEQADWENDLRAAMERPTVSSMMALTSHPARMEALAADLTGRYQPWQRARNLQDAAVVASALNEGNVRVAYKRLRDRRAGLAANVTNPEMTDRGSPAESTEVTDALMSHIRSGDPRRLDMARGTVGLVMALSVDPEDAPRLLARAGFNDDRAPADRAEDKRVAGERERMAERLGEDAGDPR